jgi:hypothetical protein
MECGDRIVRSTFVCAIALVLTLGCSHASHLGPPTILGAGDIGGPVMTSAPPPPGWSLKAAVPPNQREAQDTIMDYLERTLAVLPPGTAMDGNGHPASGQTAWV